MHKHVGENECTQKEVATILSSFTEAVLDDQIVQHDRQAYAYIVGQSPYMRVRTRPDGETVSPPTDPPVVTIPIARLRRFLKYCETTEMAGRKIRPVPIPTPKP